MRRLLGGFISAAKERRAKNTVEPAGRERLAEVSNGSLPLSPQPSCLRSRAPSDLAEEGSGFKASVFLGPHRGSLAFSSYD